MPARDKIQEKIFKAKHAAQDSIRREYLKDLSNYTKRDTIIYITAFATPKIFASQKIGPMTSIMTDDIQYFMSAVRGLKNDKLDLVLHSPGGSAEAAEQIVNYLRSKYNHIRAIIPQNAMSAATMIACACDEIIMGKQSAIGPIDPQITMPSITGRPFTAPAHAILNEFEQAKKEIRQDPKTGAIWVNKLQTLPHGVLDICRKTIDRSKDLVATWLKDYMLKEEEKKEEISTDIAQWLSDAGEHKSHGKPINYQLARQKGLAIRLMEEDHEFQDKVLSVFHASMITLMVSNCIKIVENQSGQGTFLNVDPQSNPK